MTLIADGLLIAGALTAALYCWVLSRRLQSLKRMDRGLGGAIAGLSARVEQTKASLADTKASTSGLTEELAALTARAEIAAGRLELLLGVLKDRSPSKDSAEDGPFEPGSHAVSSSDRTSGERKEPSLSGVARGAAGAENDLISALRRVARTGAGE